MKNKSISSYSNIGTTSLLIIFLVLCMATFSTLSLSTAKRDYDYSVKMAEHRIAYQEACNQAEEYIADRLSSLQSSSDETFAVPIGADGAQKLIVSVRYFPEDGVKYSVDEWRVVSATEWTADNHIQLVDIGE